ncbi:unnamed protein product, partial [Polarella glacialis]
TGDVSTYAQATGNLHLVIAVMQGRKDNGPGQPLEAFEDVLQLRTNKLKPLTFDGDISTPDKARQDFCGLAFAELWSEDGGGFPMPDGCFYDEDTTDPEMTVKQLHIIFGEGNGMRKNTKYMAVVNMNILPKLGKDFPNQ